MALFNYEAIDKEGNPRKGEIEAHTIDVAISSLQNRGLIISEIKPADKKSLFDSNITLGGVKNKDIVILSKQLSTLFEAQVSALRVFRLLAKEAQNPILRKALDTVANDISDGSAVTAAMSKHPKVFSNFYVNMVAAGEESGKLSSTFTYLADYMDRAYELTSKAKNALVYPAFVISVFFIVMYLMLTMVIPKISTILIESGQELPFITKIVVSFSNFLADYGIFFVASLVIFGALAFRYSRTDAGAAIFDEIKLSIPAVGSLFEKLYLARIAGNMNMMLTSGISMVKTLDNTAAVVDNKVYEDIMTKISQDVSTGSSVSDAMDKHEKIPSMLAQMVRIGEETGRMSTVLDTMAHFYEREVINAVDTLVGLIEPAMIVLLGVGVGGLLASVLIPIYNVTGAV